ncbi:MAG TPA: DUF3105 domain-containing protein [Gaiellaceae bacterium]
MAKKSRTPPPPRRVQAPKRREGGSRGTAAVTADQRRQRLMLYALGGSGLVILAIVLVVIFVFGGSSSSGGQTKALSQEFVACGGSLQTYPSEGRGHLFSLTAKVHYKTFPPTSGKHYAVPAIFDLYDTPLKEIQLVHNLEHGAIVIQYGSKVSQADVQKIGDFYRSDPNALVVAPLPKLGNKIALTAWTHLGTCSRFSESAFKGFRSAYRYKGPEHFPPSALNPGE